MTQTEPVGGWCARLAGPLHMSIKVVMECLTLALE